MFYHLPPVGNSVCLSKEAGDSMSVLFPGYKTQYYHSGTAALSAAIVTAIKQQGIKVPDIKTPEIILPAYACPDLLSAIFYAGAKPVLVDIEADRPWLDLSSLRAAITENTAAIIGVNLFGILERWSQLRDIANQNNVILIEDSAQYFPVDNKAYDWQGDLVVISFGRGKPVSLLGGGAVLVKNKVLSTALSTVLSEGLQLPLSMVSGFAQRVSYGLKTRLYNAMISPYLYWLPQLLPFLHLGETRYHVLAEIERMDAVRQGLLAANIKCYQSDVAALACCDKISTKLDSLGQIINGQIINLPRACEAEAEDRLLRYPVLVPVESRNQIYLKLQQAGLGVSILYPSSLPNIDGVSEVMGNEQTFPNADRFASQLITLPTHANVSDSDIDKMRLILSQ